MTPEEKARDIYYKFTAYAPFHPDNKNCAIIAVNEIMENLTFLPYGIQYLSQRDYWDEVKMHIVLL
jgi:hypothetical protein